nr:MAG TPA: hypothetical protein [Caudoviricetes sp.]
MQERWQQERFMMPRGSIPDMRVSVLTVLFRARMAVR